MLRPGANGQGRRLAVQRQRALRRNGGVRGIPRLVAPPRHRGPSAGGSPDDTVGVLLLLLLK